MAKPRLVGSRAGLVATGLAYPTFDSKPHIALRRAFAREVKKACPSKGVWPSDRIESGTDVADVHPVTDEAVMMPKLFRRLVDYLHVNHNHPSLAGFNAYLAEGDNRLVVL